jgi:protein phosphatase
MDPQMKDDQPSNRSKWSPTSTFPGPLDSPPPLSIKVEAGFGARSRRGPRRSINDDHYLIMSLGRHHEALMTSLPDNDLLKRFVEFGYGMFIADGLGSDGEAASRLAISTLVQLAINFGKWHVRVDEPIAAEMIDRAKRFYREVDSTLQQAGRDGDLGLQSTLTVVYSAGPELFFAHVGHSRAYMFRDDHLVQLTHDHTGGRERPGTAAIPDATADARHLHPIVTETLGGSGADVPRIDIERCGLMDNDLVLLCTNGLTDVVDDQRIANTLRLHATPDDQCRALVDLAANSGSDDDVTALVAHYRIHE